MKDLAARKQDVAQRKIGQRDQADQKHILWIPTFEFSNIPLSRCSWRQNQQTPQQHTTKGCAFKLNQGLEACFYEKVMLWLPGGAECFEVSLLMAHKKNHELINRTKKKKNESLEDWVPPDANSRGRSIIKSKACVSVAPPFNPTFKQSCSSVDVCSQWWRRWGNRSHFHICFLIGCWSDANKSKCKGHPGRPEVPTGSRSRFSQPGRRDKLGGGGGGSGTRTMGLRLPVFVLTLCAKA